MLMLNQLKGHEATFGVLHVDSPLDHVFLITSWRNSGKGLAAVVIP
jgi:hypothetical protein